MANPKGTVRRINARLYALLLAALLAGPFASPLQANSLGWWRADQNTYDSSGNNHGTLYAGGSFATGVSGSAFALDGQTGYVHIQDYSPQLDGMRALTLAAWIKANTVSEVNAVVTKYDSRSDRVSYWLSIENGRLRMGVCQKCGINPGANVSYAIAEAELGSQSLSSFVHVAGVWRGQHHLQLYVNGAAATTSIVATMGDAPSVLSSNSTPVEIGRFHSRSGSQTGPFGYFDGLIDEVHIYSIALDSVDIECLYLFPEGDACISTTDPVIAHAEFGEISSSPTLVRDGDAINLSFQIASRHAANLEVELKVQPNVSTSTIDLLPPQALSASLAPNAVLPVQFSLKVGDWSWQTPSIRLAVRGVRQGSNQPVLDATVVLHVAPRPVFMIHGFNSGVETWDEAQRVLAAERIQFNDWSLQAIPIRTGGFFALNSDSVLAASDDLAAQIEQRRASIRASEVDLLAHSKGGLVSRVYINRLMRVVTSSGRVVRSLITLGTPWDGTPCADLWIFGSGAIELRPAVVRDLMMRYANLRGVQLHTIYTHSIPLACFAYSLVAYPELLSSSDIIVPAQSAAATWASTPLYERPLILHTSQTGSHELLTELIAPLLRGDVVGGFANASYPVGETSLGALPAIRSTAVSGVSNTFRGRVEPGQLGTFSLDFVRTAGSAYLYVYTSSAGGIVQVFGSTGLIDERVSGDHHEFIVPDPSHAPYLFSINNSGGNSAIDFFALAAQPSGCPSTSLRWMFSDGDTKGIALLADVASFNGVCDTTYVQATEITGALGSAPPREFVRTDSVPGTCSFSSVLSTKELGDLGWTSQITLSIQQPTLGCKHIETLLFRDDFMITSFE